MGYPEVPHLSRRSCPSSRGPFSPALIRARGWRPGTRGWRHSRSTFFLFGFVKLFFKPRNDLAQEVLKGISGNSNLPLPSDAVPRSTPKPIQSKTVPSVSSLAVSTRLGCVLDAHSEDRNTFCSIWLATHIASPSPIIVCLLCRQPRHIPLEELRARQQSARAVSFFVLAPDLHTGSVKNHREAANS